MSESVIKGVLPLPIRHNLSKLCFIGRDLSIEPKCNVKKKQQVKIMSRRKNKVYFIRAVDENKKDYGPIKIGVSNNPKKRLVSIQTGNSNKLRIISTILGGRRRERLLHEEFKDSRLTGEWFKPTKRLLDFINNLNKPKFYKRLDSKNITPNVTILNKDISNVFVNTENPKYTVLTHKLFKLGMSKNGAWSDKQLSLLDVKMPKKKGWKHKIIGNTYPVNIIEQFIYLKDVHLKHSKLNSFKY